MTRPERIIIKISLLLLIVLFSSLVFASTTANPMDEYDSIYRYNALENKTSFITTTSVNNPDNLKEKSSESSVAVVVVVDDSAKKLKDITEQQISSIKKSEEATTAIENRGAIGSFIIGNKLGTLKYQMVQMKDQSHFLNALSLDIKDSATKNQINNQLQILEKQQTKIENFILKQQNRFSLFGWFVNSL